MVQEISHVNSQNKYIILNRRASEGKRELNVQAQVKTRNGKSLKVKALVDSGCTHMRIDKQLVKDKRIQTKKIDFFFEVFNADGTKNGEVTKVVLWDAWDMNNFYFLFPLFSDFIGILFSFFFFFWTMKRHVTSQSHDRSHDVTS